MTTPALARLRALPADVLPALIAFLAGLSGLGAALFLLALRAPAPAALAAAALVALRTDQVRVGLDAYVTQAAGLALAPAALGAVVLALAVARSRPAVALAALLAGGLAAHSVEYFPFLVLASALVVILGLALPRRLGLGGAPDRVTLLRTAAALAVATLVLQPVGVVRGLASLVSTGGRDPGPPPAPPAAAPSSAPA